MLKNQSSGLKVRIDSRGLWILKAQFFDVPAQRIESENAINPCGLGPGVHRFGVGCSWSSLIPQRLRCPWAMWSKQPVACFAFGMTRAMASFIICTGSSNSSISYLYIQADTIAFYEYTSSCLRDCSTTHKTIHLPNVHAFIVLLH